MRALTMPEIRQTIDLARQQVGREDTESFALVAPGLIARLVEILDGYVGHEPTVAEESAYARAEIERRDAAIADALRLLESAPEAFSGGGQNIGAAAHVLRQVGSDAPKDTREGESTRVETILPALGSEGSCTGIALNGVHTQVFHCRQTADAHELHLWRTGLEWFTCRGEAR